MVDACALRMDCRVFLNFIQGLVLLYTAKPMQMKLDRQTGETIMGFFFDFIG